MITKIWGSYEPTHSSAKLGSVYDKDIKMWGVIQIKGRALFHAVCDVVGKTNGVKPQEKTTPGNMIFVIEYL